MSLIGNYIGAGAGKAVEGIGEMMFRGQERDRELALRSEERALDRQLRADIAEAKQEPKLGDDETNELVAGQLGTSVPEVTAHRDAVRTGDESQFKLDDYPAGVSADTIAAKRKSIYGLLEQYKTGKDYKPLEEGRSEAHKRGLIDKAIDEPGQAPAIAQGVAAGAGKGAYGGNSDVVRNEFTGDVTTTDIGRARIAGLQSDAKLDRAKIDEIAEKIRTGVISKEDSDRLTTVIEKANSTIKLLTDNPPGRDPKAREEWKAQMNEWSDLRERTRVLLSSRLDARETPKPAPAKPKPAVKPPAGAKPKGDYRHLWNKPGT